MQKFDSLMKFSVTNKKVHPLKKPGACRAHNSNACLK